MRVILLLKLDHHVVRISLHLDLSTAFAVDCDPGVGGERWSRYGTINSFELCAAKFDPVALVLFLCGLSGVVVVCAQLPLVNFDVN
jgi:hypothetical protein